MAQPNTALSPEWDRWFDEAFIDLIVGDADLNRAEFDALISATWPAPPAPSDTVTPPTPDSSHAVPRPSDTP
jgi:hypothetical protein